MKKLMTRKEMKEMADHYGLPGVLPFVSAEQLREVYGDATPAHKAHIVTAYEATLGEKWKAMAKK